MRQLHVHLKLISTVQKRRRKEDKVFLFFSKRPFVASRQGFFKEERGFYNSRYNPLLSSKRGEGASMG
ncbi:unnamed protein product, partial [Musa banksii]